MSHAGGIPAGSTPAGGIQLPPEGAPPPEAGSPVTVNDDGTLNIPGPPPKANVTANSPEGAAALAKLPPEQLAEVVAKLKAKGATNEQLQETLGMLHLKIEGDMIVPNDHYDNGELAAQQSKATGQVGQEGFTPEEAFVAQLYKDAGVPIPPRAQLNALYKQLKDSPDFQKAVDKLKAFISNPTSENLKGFAAYMMEVQAKNPHGNVMELLFLVMRESIKDMNEDKKYYLQKLEMYNKMGEQLADYLGELVDASTALSEASASAKYPEMMLTAAPVNVRRFDLDAMGPDGKLVETGNSYSKRVTSSGLNNIIKDVEAQQETLRNKRQMASTAFQNFDQKTNQLYNMLASVLKTMNEMRGIGAGSRSGL